jgi:hypothetical protein
MRQRCANEQAGAGGERALRLAASARHLEGGHARAGCEGRVRVRARRCRAECELGCARAEPGRVRAEQVLGRVVMPRQAVSRAGARVSTRVLRVCVP